MRLIPEEKEILVEVVRTSLSPREGKLYLYGSRTNDWLKGGDIDLLLLVEDEALQEVKDKKFMMLAEFKKRIGNRRIDLTISSNLLSQTDPFLSSILSQAILLEN